MDLKSLLQEFAASVTTPTIERRQILEFFSGKTDMAKALDAIKAACAAAVISNSPTVYNTAAFKECVTAYVPAPSVAKEDAPKDRHAADGRSDKNQPNIIKTKSYRELEELIHPQYPINIYISGETGLGKSTAVFGIAHKFDKPVIRVNMSGATDLDDLIGGIRIVDGNTVFDPGPVAIAMELGAILLLDECDAGKPQVLIDLHPVLEKKGVLAKKARKMIYPAPGFCVIATGNSKGVGDASGKYIGVNTMNHAFLQRFGASVEFLPPTRGEMEAMLEQAVPELSFSIRHNLCNWYEHVVETHEAGGVDEYINPRKMIDIATLCLIFGAKKGTDTATQKAVRTGLTLSETSLVNSLVQLYDTIVKDVSEPTTTKRATLTEPARLDESGATIPF